MNGGNYLELLQDRVSQLFWSSAAQRNLLCLKDEAPPHYINVAKFFLKAKFQERVDSKVIEFV